MFQRHPEFFRDHFDHEYLVMTVFVMHHIMIGEKSFWHPFWEVISLADLPMRWEEHEIEELQDPFLQREIKTFKDEYYAEWDSIFDVFYQNGYEDLWPGITDTQKGKDQIKAELEQVFYRSFNSVVTRCFGWGLPRTSMIPLADCINHHNVDSTYEFICRELHDPIRNLGHDEQSAYNMNINEFLEQNMAELKLENPDETSLQNQSYYTKSKMMLDVSDLYLSDDEGEPGIQLKQRDVRSSVLTNRSIYTIKKVLIR